jgi:hypothetical protein
MEQIVQAVIGGAVAVVQKLYEAFGQQLGVAVLVALLAWLFVERVTPPDWPAWKNRTAAAALGLAMTILAHAAVPALTYGPGLRGVAAAAFFGVMGGGGSWLFHDLVAKRCFPDQLLRSSGKGDPVEPAP